LAIDPITGFLWDTENGDKDYDEINVVPPGFNSGWNKLMGPISENNVRILVRISVASTL
jgi:aldose sugar dehydrogenase